MQIEAIVIGAGQAGLAMSRCLARHGVVHVVLERGCIAERWRSERWDSLRLLTPNWMSRLPGWSYGGGDPDGFMSAPEVVRYLASYAGSFAAPVLEATTVRAVTWHGTGFRVEADRGVWTAPIVVLATGHCEIPAVPAQAGDLPASILQLTPSSYRRPEALPPGGVLVVGASASGVQIAQELRRAGREVVLAAGRHTRLPRRYLDRDIMWWMDRAGILDEPVERMPDSRRARSQPSLQLIGSPECRDIDLGVLHREGVLLAGRLTAIEGGRATFADDLARNCADADARMLRVLTRIHAATGLDAPPAMVPIQPPPSPGRIDLEGQDIGTVVWATGFARNWRWLNVPVLDGAGEVLHAGGVTPVPGLYILGMRFLRRRNSSFLDGVGADAAELLPHILHHLSAGRRTAA